MIFLRIRVADSTELYAGSSYSRLSPITMIEPTMVQSTAPMPRHWHLRRQASSASYLRRRLHSSNEHPETPPLPLFERRLHPDYHPSDDRTDHGSTSHASAPASMPRARTRASSATDCTNYKGASCRRDFAIPRPWPWDDRRTNNGNPFPIVGNTGTFDAYTKRAQRRIHSDATRFPIAMSQDRPTMTDGNKSRCCTYKGAQRRSMEPPPLPQHDGASPPARPTAPLPPST